MTLTMGFPFSFAATGRTRVPDVELRLKELIEMLLYTIPGERVMRPGFGTPVIGLLFEGMSDALDAALQAAIHGALMQHLAGIADIRSVEVQAQGSALEVTIVYAPAGEQVQRSIQFKRDRP
jgi:uncharacterized protein